MPGIALTPEQEKMKQEIIATLNQLIQWDNLLQEEVNRLLDVLADTCFALHVALQTEGQEPRYGQFVSMQRGMKPGNREFYRHMYAAEALLEFLEKGPPVPRTPKRT